MAVEWYGIKDGAAMAVGYVSSAWGRCEVVADATGLISVDWLTETELGVAAQLTEPSAADDRVKLAPEVGGDIERARQIAQEAVVQLEEYFAGTRRTFTVPLALRTGTEFQRAVWKYLMEIPYGETRSYKDVAEAIGRDKAVRAVGQANRANPIAIVVPCHRVIGHNGSLTGYAGSQVHLKAALLELERDLVQV